ncbi:amidohydrolase family protein [Streptomyces malaysiensis subsp. malaysiensis]|uniref:amidohydrolase family protein n=1 Tax=Streptomyces malaysiensis TaxID=92644 RepID=UPI0024BF19E8|nr:amidohydrolase family protein [Streptomyces sp. NA07423]WHX22254.1 amidohydrolase family protein [Streptomyces sp. NA07423]
MTTRVFRNAHLLTMDPALGDVEHGDLIVEGDRILEVGTGLQAPAGAEIVDATDRIILPGFVDTHRHMWQGVLRGIAPGHTFERYMENILGDFGPAMTPRDLYTGNLLSARAALASGITTIQDISNIQDSPAHTDALVAALQESGMRAVFAYGKSFPDILAHGTVLPDDTRRVRAELLADTGALVTMALVTEGGSDADERANAALAGELEVPVARHFSSRLSAAHLRDIDALRPGTTFIHGNGLGAEELAVIADSGGSISISPAIEMIMGHGYPMVAPALARPNLPVSLSVDVEVTVAGDMFTQMRAAYQAGRHAQHTDDSRTGVTVRDILRMATLDGARSLALADRTGSLTPGKQADILVLRADRPDVTPVHDPYSTVVLQMDRSHIDTVMVAGHDHIRAGRAVADSSDLLRDAARTARRLGEANISAA